MTVNRYDKPVQSEYVSQYTPIPFEQLYNLGKYYNEEVDKAYNDLSMQLAKWSEFRSPSAVDTQRWYDLTTGGAQNIVNQLAANPDLIKTQEGRQMISSYINSRPYALLSQLKETAANAEMRNKMVAEMKAKGLYADWMDDPRLTPQAITNWSTEMSGVMNDIAPVQFKDLQTIGDPYVKDLKETFYKSVDPNTGQRKAYTDWMAITANDIARSFMPALTDIISTPQGKAWYNRYAQQVLSTNPNASKEDIDNVFLNALVQSQSDKIRSTPVTDEVALKLALSTARGRGNESPSFQAMPYTRQMELTGLMNYRNNFTPILFDKFVNKNDAAKLDQLAKELEKNPNDPTLNTMYKQAADTVNAQLRKGTETYSIKNYVTDLFDSAMKDTAANKGKGITNKQTNNIVNNFIQQFGYDVSGTDNNLLLTMVPNISRDTEDTPVGDTYIVNNVKDLTLAKRFVMSLQDKYNFARSQSLNKVETASRTGKLQGMYLMGVGKIVSLPIADEDGISSESKQVVHIGIPESSLQQAGLTGDDVRKAGGNIVWVPSKNTSTTTKKYKKNEDGTYTEVKFKDKKTAKSISSREVLYEPVYTLDYMQDLPNTKEGLRAFSLNQSAWKLGMSGTQQGNEYGSTQFQSY